MRIFLVEDEPAVSAALIKGLHRWGFSIQLAQDFDRVLQECDAFSPDLILLDVSLPRYNGYYWCEQLRARKDTPIIFLSSHAEEMDILMAMRLGADDYIVKPFSVDILVAKIQAVLRRARAIPADAPRRVCGAVFDFGAMTIATNGQTLELTRNESKILDKLTKNAGQAVSREDLMLHLWNSDEFIDDNTLTVNVNRLRKKLKQLGLEDCIATRHGVGYLLHDS